MAERETPIAWLALPEGTPVIASDGRDVGKVTEVVADRERDIFSGVSFRAGLLDRDHFVPADQVDEITTDAVHLKLGSVAAEQLEPYEP